MHEFHSNSRRVERLGAQKHAVTTAFPLDRILYNLRERLFQEDLRDLKRDIALRIAEIRTQFGLTQPDLAAKMELEQRWIAQIESGHQNLTLATLLKLSHALGVHITDFFQPPKPKVGQVRPRKTKKRRRTRGG